MKNVRAVPVIAVALAIVFLALPASAANDSNSFQQPNLAFLGGEAPSSADPGPWFPVVGPNPQNIWTPAAPIPAGVVRYAQAQCLGENRFFVISGVGPGGALTGNVFRYDAGPNAWTPLAPFPTPAEGPTGVCFQGKIYVAGGSTSLNIFRIYDIATNAWSVGAPVPRSVVMAAMGASAGKVYLIGGDSDFQPANGVSTAVDIYDIATNTWSAGAPMPTGTVSPGYAQIGNFVYVVGGWGVASPATNVNVSQRYNMTTNTWEVGPTFTSARSDLVLSASNTALYAIGGDSNAGGFFDLSAVVERLTVATWPAGAWTAADPLPSARSGHKGGFCTQTFLPTGEVWSTGGIAAPFPTFSADNQYLNAEACPSAAAATALSADAAGNRVIEPGETAVVAPTWRNTGGGAIPGLTGTASNFTGPAGPTYTLDDPTANYGAVAAGAEATCATTGDCYAVTASGTRPATHWDTTLTETLSIGAQKTWTLHIGGSFGDLPTTNPFYRFVELLLHKSITGGCATGQYCPGDSTTRAQMAVFVLVSKEGIGFNPPACAAPNLFVDVPDSSPFCKFIEELANRGVVAGCNPGFYCPDNPVTRAQMSIFVLRTLDGTLSPPACVAGSERFDDVPASSAFCRWIEELARRNIVTGCSATSYCPEDPVTRAQMGVFLALTFGLTLYGI
jgi:hypothetical protein